MKIEPSAEAEATHDETQRDALATVKQWHTPGFETIAIAEITQNGLSFASADLSIFLS